MLKQYIKNDLNQHGSSHVQQRNQNPSNCNYVVMYDELFNIIRNNSSEEVKLKKIGEFFEKELKPDINFQNTSGDTLL